MRKKVVLFYKNTKYSTHYHAYINERGNICVRKRDTTYPDNYDTVDVLRLDESKHFVGSRFRTYGKAHISRRMIANVEEALRETILNRLFPDVDYDVLPTLNNVTLTSTLKKAYESSMHR